MFATPTEFYRSDPLTGCSNLLSFVEMLNQYSARLNKQPFSILPNTSGEGGKLVAERFCYAIKEASLSWMFPTTITIGVATYPEHASHVDTLIDIAEKAMKKGKDEGTD